MNTHQDFEVEKILRRRIQGGQVEYRIKWKNFPSSENSWVNVEMMACPKLLIEFETNSIRKIIGVKQSLIGELEYACTWNDGWVPEFKPAAIAKQRYPMQVANYLESIIQFVIVRGVTFFNEFEETDADGQPVRIVSASNVGGQLKYLFEWPNGEKKFFSSFDAKMHHVHLVIEFLESKIVAL